MAFDKKFPFLNALGCDVMVVQECSEKAIKSLEDTGRVSTFWIGKNQNKGLGVIVKSPWRITSIEPLDVSFSARVGLKGPVDLDLYPVWACKVHVGKNYIGQIHQLLDSMEGASCHQNTVVMGDFHSNSIWDREHGSKSHTSAVNRFKKVGLISAWHSSSNEMQGKETRPTIFFRKDRERPYHIDYVFLSAALAGHLHSTEIGSPSEWIKHSDHFPVVVELNR